MRLDALLDAARDELSTLADLARFSASRMGEAGLHFGHGTDNALDEAVELVLGASALAPGLPTELWSAALTLDERARILTLLRRRIVDRVPLPYLVGRAWFAGLEFVVDERVLIPRSPLAEWIERAFEPFVDPDSVWRVLDLGTGSGCIAVAAAHAFPAARVDAVDIDPGALEVAEHNVRRHGLEDRVHVVRSDLFDAAGGPYDLVVSNPPYVDAQAMATAAAEYRHEPAGALAGGEDGLDVAARILAQAREVLSEKGVLVLEVGASRAALESRFPELPCTWLETVRGGEGLLLARREDLTG